MKCGYKNCKLGGEVSKEDGIKESTRYFHKECLNKKHIKAECRELLKKKGFLSKSINTALKKYIDDEENDIDYILFTIKYVIKNNLRLTNPYGIKYHMSNYKIANEYEDVKKSQGLKKLKEVDNTEWDLEEAQEIEYKKSKDKKYLKIL